MKNENPVQAIVNCDTCEVSTTVPYTEITLVCNQTTQAWTYTYFCNGCGRRQVYALHDELVLAMQSVGTEILVTSNPIPSLPRGDYSSQSPAISEVDLHDFIVSLNTNDFLAAYA